jgi:hypothetical protein
MLDAFIVLGLIPGTQAQITFTTWLLLSGIVFVGVCLWRGYRHQTIQRLVITSEIIALTHRSFRGTVL